MNVRSGPVISEEIWRCIRMGQGNGKYLSGCVRLLQNISKAVDEEKSAAFFSVRKKAIYRYGKVKWG